jgi:hypothetical protein
LHEACAFNQQTELPEVIHRELAGKSPDAFHMAGAVTPSSSVDPVYGLDQAAVNAAKQIVYTPGFKRNSLWSERIPRAEGRRQACARAVRHALGLSRRQATSCGLLKQADEQELARREPAGSHRPRETDHLQRPWLFSPRPDFASIADKGLRRDHQLTVNSSEV